MLDPVSEGYPRPAVATTKVVGHSLADVERKAAEEFDQFFGPGLWHQIGLSAAELGLSPRGGRAVHTWEAEVSARQGRPA